MPGTEIERRFLVRVPVWAGNAASAEREHIVQFYLAAEPGRTVRIRLAGDGAVLTVKGPSVNAQRTEIECDVPLATARALLDAGLHVGTAIEKTRSALPVEGLLWQVDQFEGANAGLVIAEVELTGDDDRSAWDARVDRHQPAWLGREITGEPHFANSSLALHPFARWPKAEREAVLREITATS